MKIVIAFFIIFTIIACFGCSNGFSDSNKIAKDTLTEGSEIARANRFLIDTIIEQNRVIGDIKFGMTKLETENKIDSFKISNRQNSSVLFLESGNYIGSYKYDNIYSYYSNDSLYEIDVIGSENINEFLKRIQFNSLGDLIKRKYGEPNRENEETNFQLPKMEWNIGLKTIVIEKIRKDFNGEYIDRVDMKIYQSKILEKLRLQSDKELTRYDDSMAKAVF